jgi:predicted transcriptional regulator
MDAKNKIQIEISQSAYESLIQLAQINKTTQSYIIERAIKTFGNPLTIDGEYREFLTALNNGRDYVLEAMEVEKELQAEAEKHGS